MTLQLKVPSIMCENCVKTISSEIQTHFPKAKINADLESKIVTVDTTAETTATREAIAEAIVAAGHEIA